MLVKATQGLAPHHTTSDETCRHLLSKEWEEGRRFGGMIVVEKKEEALRTAKEWDRPDTVWTDGSRQEDGAVGAACV